MVPKKKMCLCFGLCNLIITAKRLKIGILIYNKGAEYVTFVQNHLKTLKHTPFEFEAL